MARPRDPEIEQRWRQRLQRQHASGLSVAAFCDRERVSAVSLYAWKRRLADATGPATGPAPLFVPVRPSPGLTPTRVVLELPQQVRIQLDQPPEPAWLAQLVDALAMLPEREATP